MRAKTQAKTNKNIERLKLPVQITDIKSYAILHDFLIVGDYDKLHNQIIAFHPSAYMNINGTIYYEIACSVLNCPRKLYSPPELAKKILGRDKERKITNNTRVFIPWKCSKSLTTHDSDKLHIMFIKRAKKCYNFEIFDFTEFAGNKLDMFEYMENMMNRYMLPVPEFADCLNSFKDTKNKKPIETYELEIKEDEEEI